MITKTLKKYWHKYHLRKGLRHFDKTGDTTPEGYKALRSLFVLTRGKSNDKLTDQLSKNIGKYNLNEISGVLGDLTLKELTDMVNVMKTNGYYIFNTELPADLVSELYQQALNTPSTYLDVNTHQYSNKKVLIDLDHPISPRYQFTNEAIVNFPSVQKLIFDRSLLAFAQEYLGVKPILDLIAMWWSLPFQGKGKSEAAQMYHFDLDRIKFIKFFFYLTDVDTNTGPHCYVRGSHKELPLELARDGRFTDDEISDFYGEDKLVEISGKRGTIMAVDTRGFHKGKELLEGARLLFQIEFANSMFGQTYPPVPINYASSELAEQANRYSYTYNKMLIPQSK